MLSFTESKSDDLYSNMGIKSTNMLKNLGTFLFAFVAIGLVITLLVLFKFLMLKTQLTTKIYKFIEGRVFFNSVIRSVLTSYLTMSISTFISLKNLKKDTPGDLMSTSFTIISLVLIVTAPYLSF